MDRADAPLLLDVRREAKFRESPRLLAGARYCAPEDVAAFAASQPPREVVAYCVYGHNVSADAVGELRAAGWNARMPWPAAWKAAKTASMRRRTSPNGARSARPPSPNGLTGASPANSPRAGSRASGPR